MSIREAVASLRSQRNQLAADIEKIDKAIALLEGTDLHEAGPARASSDEASSQRDRGVRQPPRRTSARTVILGMFEDDPGATIHVEEFVRALERPEYGLNLANPRSSAHSALSKMTTARVLERVDDGLYRLTRDEEDVAAPSSSQSLPLDEEGGDNGEAHTDRPTQEATDQHRAGHRTAVVDGV